MKYRLTILWFITVIFMQGCVGTIKIADDENQKNRTHNPNQEHITKPIPKKEKK